MRGALPLGWAKRSRKEVETEALWKFFRLAGKLGLDFNIFDGPRAAWSSH